MITGDKMEDIMVICKKCGNKAPVSSMKLDYDEKLTICPDCVKNKKIHRQIEHEVLHKAEGSILTDSRQTNNVQEEKATKIAHKCTSCGYKFKIDPESRVPRNCPYCNDRVMSF